MPCMSSMRSFLKSFMVSKPSSILFFKESSSDAQSSQNAPSAATRSLAPSSGSDVSIDALNISSACFKSSSVMLKSFFKASVSSTHAPELSILKY